MQPWLRLLVTCLLALALPAQGIAAVTRAHCGPSHQRMQLAAPAGHAGHLAHAGHHGHHAPGAPHGHGVAAAAAAAPDDTGTVPSTDTSGTDLAKFKCSSCAACCVGSALARAMPQVPQPAAARTVFAVVQVTIEAYASDGPDRPPRSLIA